MRNFKLLVFVLAIGFLGNATTARIALGQKDTNRGVAVQKMDGAKAQDSCCKNMGHGSMMGSGGKCADGKCGDGACADGMHGDGRMGGMGCGREMDGRPMGGMPPMMCCPQGGRIHMIFRCIFGLLFIVILILFIMMQLQWLSLLRSRSRNAKAARTEVPETKP